MKRFGLLVALLAMGYISVSAAQAQQAVPSPNGNGTITLVSTSEGTLPTYYASVTNTTPVVGVNSVICGSATKGIHVRSVSLNGYATTAGGMGLVFRTVSTAPTGGTPGTINAGLALSTNAAATATVKYFTGAPTTGSNVAHILDDTLSFPLEAAATPARVFLLGQDSVQSIILNGAASCLQVELSGTVPTGAVINISYVWVEQ